MGTAKKLPVRKECITPVCAVPLLLSALFVPAWAWKLAFSLKRYSEKPSIKFVVWVPNALLMLMWAPSSTINFPHTFTHVS
jgi:hypothetical protein